MPTSTVFGACPHDCPDTCGLVTVVEDGRAVKISGDPDHPITDGWLCAKVRPYLDHVYHQDRLTVPLRRAGSKGGGQWRAISWPEAIAEIVERWQTIIADYGPAAILPYSYSGTLGLVQMVVASGRFWNRLGASQLGRSICGAAAEKAVESTLGERWSPAYSDVLHSRLVLIWGHNPVSTAPHFMPYLRKAQRNGAKLVVVDPRRTRTAKGADWHLAPVPGTDGILALGLANIIVTEGLHDEEWLAENSVGWPRLREQLSDYPPERVAAMTGLPEADICRLARLYANERPGLIKIADGINRNRNGGQTVRAICTLPALTGQYGVRGGGLAYSSSGYLRWDSDAINKWSECPPASRKVNMNRLGAALLGEASDPPIKSLFVFGANPAASAPNTGSIVRGMQREDLFTVVHELFMTDTADYADIVLPATSQLEQTDLHKAYGHTMLSYNRPAIRPLGKCKSNWEVMRLLAEAMGFDEPWLHQDEDEVIAEVLASTAEAYPALAQISLERLRREATVPLNLDRGIPFAGGKFPTPSGKVELFSRSLADEGLAPLPTWVEEATDNGGISGSETTFDPAESLLLISGAAHHFVSSSLANQKELLQRAGSPFVEINPRDASRRGISDGDMVIVENGRGTVHLRAVVTEAIRAGALASPKGHWNKLSGRQNVNWTTSDELADMAGQSTFHSNRVWLRRANL